MLFCTVTLSVFKIELNYYFESKDVIWKQTSIIFILNLESYIFFKNCTFCLLHRKLDFKTFAVKILFFLLE